MVVIFPMIDVIQEDMPEAEARTLTRDIKDSLDKIGARLLEIRQRRGWKSMGYASFRAYLAEEFVQSREHLYELMRAAPVQERLSGVGYSLSVNAAAELARYPVETQAAIAAATQARFNKVTEKGIKVVGAVVSDLVTTGHVDIGNGTMSKAEAALTQQEVEQVLTGRAMVNGPRQEPELVIEATIQRLLDNQTAFVVAGRVLRDGERYRLVVYALRKDKSDGGLSDSTDLR